MGLTAGLGSRTPAVSSVQAWAAKGSRVCGYLGKSEACKSRLHKSSIANGGTRRQIDEVGWFAVS